jgi:two-component system, response regulator PdtaR
MKQPVVLIVEGESLIRMSAVHMIEDAGFLAVEASNADDAIEILEDRRDIRAVFTAINMSGSIDGLKLAHAIRDRWPPIHLIVASGRDLRDGLPANGRFIRKPYSAEQIATALSELFGSHPLPGRFPSNDGGNCVKVA